MEVALVLIGFGLSLITQFATREWTKKDKADEQYDARLNQYRAELRAALAEFCGVAANFIDRGHQFAAAELAIELIEERGLDLHPDMLMHARQLMEHVMSASTVAEAKAVAVLLLLDDDALREDLEFIALRNWDVPATKETREAFALDMEQRRARLTELTKKLVGLFVPMPPKRDELIEAASPPPALPRGRGDN